MLPGFAVGKSQRPRGRCGMSPPFGRSCRDSCTPSGARRITARDTMELLSEPIATAEFMVVDTETNGLAGEDCELTEVGAVLVGGGELHDRWSSLCRTSAPLRRGIQRLTGITQADGRRRPVAGGRAPDRSSGCMQGRVLVAHNAPFDRRVLRQAFGRIGLPWPDPPVLCTAAMARSMLPLQRRRGPRRCSPTRSGSRCIPPTARWPMPRRARASCARCFRGCAPTRATIGDALAHARSAPAHRASGRCRPAACSRPRRAAPRAWPREAPRGAPGARLRRAAARSGRLPVPRRRGPGALRRQVGVDPQPRPGALRAVVAAGGVDAARHRRRLPHHRLRAGGARAREPAHQGAQAARQQAADATRRPPGLHPLPSGHPVPDPGGGAPIRPPGMPSPSDPCAAGAWRWSWWSSWTRCSDCATAAGACLGASTRRRTGRWAGACRRAWAIWTPTSTAGAWTRCWRCSSAMPAGAEQPLLTHVYGQMRAAAAQQRFERAESLRRRAGRLRTILDRLGGVLEATHARPRLILAPHPGDGPPEAFWLVGGRLVDFGPLARPGPDELAERTERALTREGRTGEVGAHVPPDEIDEVRILGTWLASHPGHAAARAAPRAGPRRARRAARAGRWRRSPAGSGGEGELDDGGARPGRLRRVTV